MNVNAVEIHMRWTFRSCASCNCPIDSDRRAPYCVPCWCMHYRTYTETVWDKDRHKQRGMGAEGGATKAMAPS